MNAIVDSLVKQAKVLSEQDKFTLLDALFDLNSPTDPAVEKAWIAECEQRSAAIDCGEIPLVSADEVMQKYRQ